jgi:hypothetical protein
MVSSTERWLSGIRLELLPLLDEPYCVVGDNGRTPGLVVRTMDVDDWAPVGLAAPLPPTVRNRELAEVLCCPPVFACCREELLRTHADLEDEPCNEFRAAIIARKVSTSLFSTRPDSRPSLPDAEGAAAGNVGDMLDARDIVALAASATKSVRGGGMY